MFQRAKFGDMEGFRYRVGSSEFTILPEAGCRLMRWDVHTASAIREVLHWPDAWDAANIAAVRGGNPLLFPFCGRTFHRGVENSWKAPDGKVRPMPKHGFARNGRFKVIAQSESSISCELIPTDHDLEAYPFSYTFTVTYTFSELAFTVNFSLHNHDRVDIPWSAGHHFYFTLPWHRGAHRGDYQLHLEAKKCAYHAPDGTLVRQKDREACHNLGDLALNDRIHWELRHRRASFGPKGGEEAVHIAFHGNPLLAPPKPFSIVTWAESTDSPYYCVEPWMGPPNATQLHWVQPARSEQFEVEISLF